jgi:ABC-2 type transport system permease protein
VAGWTAAYVAFWVLLAGALALLRRSSDVNVLVLLGVWVVGTALGPALLNVVAAAKYPLPEALELTVQQRQGYHGAWDEPLPEVMEGFYRAIPNGAASRSRATGTPTRGTTPCSSVATMPRRPRRRAIAPHSRGATVGRRRVVALSACGLPARPLAVARTDLAAHLAYLDSVAAYHERLKRHFFPAVFAEATVGEVAWDAVPRHAHRD